MATRFVHDKIFICDWKYRVDKCNRLETVFALAVMEYAVGV